MKVIRKYLFMIFVLSIAAFSGCGADVAGVAAGDIDDGLSSDYFIKSLSVDAPSLANEDDPNATKLNLKYSFVPGEWDNELEVPYSIDIITVTAEKNHTWASMYLGDSETGTELTSGDPSGPITLQVGENTVTITVVAQDGLELEYNINVIRHTAEHADAALSTLEIDGITLSPIFDPASSERTFSGSSNDDYIDITAYARSAGDGATVELIANSDEVSDWSDVPLNGGMNTIQAICTAGDGTTRETYTLNIFRQQITTTADLVALSISGASFDKPFDKDTTSYKVNLSASMNPITLVAQAESSSASVEVIINGSTIAPEDYDNITVNDGNIILVIVTNGELEKVYDISATVSTASANADLKSLKVGVGTISTRPIHPGTFVRGATYHDPNSVKFTKTVTDYVTVIYGFTSMNVTAVVDDNAASNVQFTTRRCYGTASEADGTVSAQNFASGTATATIGLDAGYVTRISITVTAASGATKVYTLYAKLLNADEFYWGIYAQPMDASKNRWTKPQPGTYNGTGLVSGTVKWVVTTAPVSTITLTNYNDGKQNFLYNDGGYVANGAHRAELKSLMAKDGWDVTYNPPFLIKTVAGEYVAELDYHLWIDDSDPAEATDSYTGIRYLSEVWHIQTFKADKPYPFTSDYNWFESWSDGQ